MTLISVASSTTPRVDSGIRPFDIGRDLRPVAALISHAFANELDARGAAALREMRMMGYMGGLLRFLNPTTGEMNDAFSGYVWVDASRVVGNITVQRSDSYGHRWQIANVAVAPSHRGRGIARRLMDQAMQHIRSAGGRWAVLQVYERNQVARRLYHQMGFEDVGGQVEMKLSKPPRRVELQSWLPAAEIPLQSFSASEWRPLYDLANSQYRRLSEWWRPLRRSDFQSQLDNQLGEWFWRAAGREQIYRRCIRSQLAFDAALILRARRWRGAHTIQLWVHPDSYGRYEEPMVDWSLRELTAYPRWPATVKLNLNHEAAQRAFGRRGFQSAQTLLTMRKPMGEA